jgi:hypothetical protein
MSKTRTLSPTSPEPSLTEPQAGSQDITPTDIAKFKTTAPTKKDGATPPKSRGEIEERSLSSVTFKELTPVDGMGVVKRLTKGARVTAMHDLNAGYCHSIKLVKNTIVVNNFFVMPVSSGCIVGYVFE